jgi:hypothetical protein
MDDKQKRYETSSVTYTSPDTMLIHKPLQAKSNSDDASDAHITLSQRWKGAGTATPPHSTSVQMFRTFCPFRVAHCHFCHPFIVSRWG